MEQFGIFIVIIYCEKNRSWVFIQSIVWQTPLSLRRVRPENCLDKNHRFLYKVLFVRPLYPFGGGDQKIVWIKTTGFYTNCFSSGDFNRHLEN
jgi:hypothetical protein